MKQNSPNPMHLWFLYLFDERKDEDGYVQCFECGKGIHESQKENTCLYSHILEKSRFPEYAGKEWNIKIVHQECHDLYTMKPKKAKKQYQLRLELLEKHKNKNDGD